MAPNLVQIMGPPILQKVTSCKHEYHLQCILEWSQSSKECPMCWELWSLKYSTSQELLAAVEQERNFRLSRSPNSPMFSRNSLDEIEFHHDSIIGFTWNAENQQRSRPEIQSFSESFKSRFSAGSSRYKKSISRSTRGFWEKLFARNSPVAELGREVSAGIAGVARMMECLDPIGKNNGTTATTSSNMEGSSAGMPIIHDVEEHQGSLPSQRSHPCDCLIYHSQFADWQCLNQNLCHMSFDPMRSTMYVIADEN